MRLRDPRIVEIALRPALQEPVELTAGEFRPLAYYEVVSLMQSSAEGFGIPLADLRLDDIVPDRDLT
jgi:hypothetical protein